MNIDILNAYCGIGSYRCHACLRVGLLAITPVFFHGSTGALGFSQLSSSVSLNADRSSVHISGKTKLVHVTKIYGRTVARLLLKLASA